MVRSGVGMDEMDDLKEEQEEGPLPEGEDHTLRVVRMVMVGAAGVFLCWCGLDALAIHVPVGDPLAQPSFYDGVAWLIMLGAWVVNWRLARRWGLPWPTSLALLITVLSLAGAVWLVATVGLRYHAWIGGTV